MDVFTEEKRSDVMSRIHSKDTGPEKVVRRLLTRAGFRYRLQSAALPGRPDLVLSKWRTVVFVNGCFWHMHSGCRLASRPESRTDYWLPKLERNRRRDLENERVLIASGWRVLVVWECACKKKHPLEALQARMATFIRNDSEQEGSFLSLGASELEAAAPASSSKDAQEKTAG